MTTYLCIRQSEINPAIHEIVGGPYSTNNCHGLCGDNVNTNFGENVPKITENVNSQIQDNKNLFFLGKELYET